MKDSVLVFRFFPLIVRDAQFVCKVPGCFGHDLVASVGTAFFIFYMIVTCGGFYLDDLLDDLRKSFGTDPGILCYLGVCSLRSSSAEED